MTDNNASNLLNIESLIKSHDQRLDVLSKELRTHKEMLEGILDNDEEYKNATTEASKYTKLKTIAKQKVLKQSESVSLVEKIKDYQAQLKELRIALSDYLAQYVTLSGLNQIEGSDGVLRTIVYTAKLVKKTE
jgi:DNA repair exonuclease SbcCD ATPase subunit